jgi:hypothetical protein
MFKYLHHPITNVLNLNGDHSVNRAKAEAERLEKEKAEAELKAKCEAE